MIKKDCIWWPFKYTGQSLINFASIKNEQSHVKHVIWNTSHHFQRWNQISAITPIYGKVVEFFCAYLNLIYKCIYELHSELQNQFILKTSTKVKNPFSPVSINRLKCIRIILCSNWYYNRLLFTPHIRLKFNSWKKIAQCSWKLTLKIIIYAYSYSRSLYFGLIIFYKNLSVY